MFTGGYTKDPEQSALAEVFSLTTMQWRTLQRLPSPSDRATFVQDGDDLILVNPHKGNILKWNEQEDIFTEIPGVSTGVTGPFSSVIALSHKDIPGC
jgi:hypothetical protein